jgi:hypothetical protein
MGHFAGESLVILCVGLALVGAIYPDGNYPTTVENLLQWGHGNDGSEAPETGGFL